MSRHSVVSFPNGTRSLAEVATGRAMHSRIGPMEEAGRVYIEQTRLGEKLAELGDPLVVWDVGLGIGANAVAAIEALSSTAGSRELHLVSFEHDLDGIRTALEARDEFPYLGQWAAMLEELLERRTLRQARLRWDLLEGDFSRRLEEAPAADIVFYDFYAPDSCPELWDAAAFSRVARTLTPDGLICTYPSATWVRIAMLLAGLHVGVGDGTDEKVETTLAALRRETLRRPLSREWLEQKLAHSKKLSATGLLSTEEQEKLQILKSQIAISRS